MRGRFRRPRAWLTVDLLDILPLPVVLAYAGSGDGTPGTHGGLVRS